MTNIDYLWAQHKLGRTEVWVSELPNPAKAKGTAGRGPVLAVEGKRILLIEQPKRVLRGDNVRKPS